MKVSPACDHCYAESFANRLGHGEDGTRFPIWGKGTARRFFSEKYWSAPWQWNAEASAVGERRRVFCGSMCDVMEEHPDVAVMRGLLYELIDATPWLDWLLLTKRPQNFRRFLPGEWLRYPRQNVWGMTTVESAEYLWRVAELVDTPFQIRAISYEPALGPVDFSPYLERIDWIIAGGESGPGARPLHPTWVRTIRNQCKAFGVPFLFKQWGDWEPIARTDGFHESPFGYNLESKLGFNRVGKVKAGRMLDGRIWDEFPGRAF